MPSHAWGTRALSAATGLVLLLSASPGAAQKTKTSGRLPGDDRPNILIIVTDDQRASGTLGVMPKTMDIFGRRGLRFPEAFATTPLCCPSRASIMTGQYVHNHGIRTNSDADLPHAETIQATLDAAGYRTATFGKFLNGWDIDSAPPHFDEWAIFTRSAHAYEGGEWNVQGVVQRIPLYATDFIREQANRFLSTEPAVLGQPWMMILTPPAPHAPYQPEAKYRKAKVPDWKKSPSVDERDRSDKPAWVRRSTPRPWKAQDIRARQLRTLMSVDDLVGSVFETLEQTGDVRNTLAFFLSDNGFLWNEHGLIGSVVSKNNPYNESIQIPFFVRWPGHLPPGLNDPRLVATIDVAPTVYDAVGIEAPYTVDGRSLLEQWRRDRMLVEFAAQGRFDEWASTVMRNYRFTEYYNERGGIAFREYYDLKDDRWELRNLLGTTGIFGDRFRRADERLESDRRCAGVTCP